jgi:CheY-like chemotaxis protein/anti-sigma regulatory factor (Ser/Thr protein kinase)
VASRAFVRSDRVLLRRVLQNYLANALRYTQRGGVVMGCRRGPGWLEIQVCDTGPGIAAHERERIYAEFSRLGERSPWGEQGLGLGLSICERIARLLGHELTLHSELGRGSTFGVRVAVAARPRVHAALPGPAVAAAAAAAAAEAAVAATPGLCVLCIDNDPSILEGMRMLLARWGLTVHVADSGATARQCLAREPVSVVLADYHLGAGENGLELLQALRRDATRPLAGALVTADHGAELERAARSAGLPLLRKPVRPAALRALLAALQENVRRGEARAGVPLP